MSKEKFNWKGLFINEDSDSKKVEVKKESPKSDTSAHKFPDNPSPVSKFPESTSKTVASDILDTIVEMYESGFESLNKPGYDFYEFFKAIKAVGSNDPQVYKMALTMAKGVDSSVTKASLIEQAEFYINEINKVHGQYKSQGNTKKQQIQDTQKKNKDILTNEIVVLEKKLLEIQNQVSVKKNELESIDATMMSEIVEIDQKIVANDVAKTKILETITEVSEGIKNNL